MADKPKGATPVDYVSPNRKEPRQGPMATFNPEPMSAWKKAVVAVSVTAGIGLGILGLQDDEPSDHDKAVYTGIEIDSGHELVLGVDGKDIKAYFVDTDAGQECVIDNTKCIDLKSYAQKLDSDLKAEGFPSRIDAIYRAQEDIDRANGYAAEHYNQPDADSNPYAQTAIKAHDTLSRTGFLDNIYDFACKAGNAGEIPQAVAESLAQLAIPEERSCDFSLKLQ